MRLANIGRTRRSGRVRRAPRPDSPARLAFVSDAVYPFNIGGKETRLHEITTALAKQGHEVTIYTMKWWSGAERSVTYDGVRFCALMRRLPLYSGERRSIRQAVIFGFACLRLGSRAFDAVDVDHMPFFPLFTVRLVCALRRKRMTATWHEVWGHRYWREYLGLLGFAAFAVEVLAARAPHEIMAVSDQTAERLRVFLAARVRVATVNPGVNFERIDAPTPPATPTDVIFAGRLLENKNIELLLRAVAAARASAPETTCTIIGEGPEREALESLAMTLGLGEAVSFHDFLPYADLYARMKAARVFVLPSTREGFGLSVLEANACGLPVITVRHPDNAAQELIVEGRNGLVVEPTVSALADAVVTALSRDFSELRAHLDDLRVRYDWVRCSESVRAALCGGEVAALPARIPHQKVASPSRASEFVLSHEAERLR